MFSELRKSQLVSKKDKYSFNQDKMSFEFVFEERIWHLAAKRGDFNVSNIASEVK
jgi:hypothetical protein